MNWHRTAFRIAWTLSLATFTAGAAKHDFKPGRLMEVTADERIDEGTSERWAIFRVQVADLMYTARAGRIRLHSGDMAQDLIVGDPVQVAVDGETLVLLKPDGKELRMRIIKRARVP
ncbi:MAG: hypothetical protein M3O20_03395 [Acidobacteriota bacterium]|nr:hypothetical protein [Acidobacteriota bacterium]